MGLQIKKLQRYYSFRVMQGFDEHMKKVLAQQDEWVGKMMKLEKKGKSILIEADTDSVLSPEEKVEEVRK